LKSVLILSNSLAQIKLIQNAISKEFLVMTANDINEIKNFIDKTDLVLIDEAFIEKTGFSIFAHILKSSSVPILALTPIDNPFYAVEALRHGAYNYLIKINRYESIISVTISEAINRFSEQNEAKKIIYYLKKRIENLEYQLMQNKEKKDALSEASVVRSKDFSHKTIIEEIISRFKKGDINLPAIPKITLKFKELIDSGAGIKELAELLKNDLAISTKLINVSNSVYYKGIKDSQTVEEAINRIGLTLTRQYVDIIANRSLYTINNQYFTSPIEDLWHHSLAVALAGQFVQDSITLKLNNDVFTLGLMHDIGKLVLFQLISELIVNSYLDKATSYFDIKEILDKFHCKFGSVLLKRWGFDNIFIQTALFHEQMDKTFLENKELLIIYFSNVLVNQIGYTIGGFKHDPLILEETEAARFLKLDKNQIKEIILKVEDSMKSINEVLN